MSWIPLAAAVAPFLLNKLFPDQQQNNDIYQQSRLTPEQQQIERQRLRALQGPGAGGAFGDIADYYRDLMDPNSAISSEMFAPEQRRFSEETIPGLAEQFAGLGAGGLSSSGFRNAGLAASTDLAERLGALRQQLRSHGAAGLANLGGAALQPTVENVRNTPQPSFGENLAQGIGQVAPQLALQYFQGQQQQQQIQQPQAQLKAQGLRNTSPYGKNGLKFGMQPNTSGPYGLPTFGGF